MDSYDSPTPVPTPGAHIPIALLAVALSLFFLAQFQDAGVDALVLENQKRSLDTFTEDLNKQRDQKKEDQKDRQEQTAVALKQQAENEDAKKEAKEVETAQKAGSRMKQLNQQLADSTKLYNDQKPYIEKLIQDEKKSTEIIQAIEALAKDKDPDAQKLMEIIARTGINVQKPEENKDKDKDKTPEKKNP
jgi:hypothetical protein